jgi:AraC family transcriptional regulator, transcriptional activator of pobA
MSVSEKIPIYGINTFNPNPGAAIQYRADFFSSQNLAPVQYPHRHDDFYEILHIKTGTGTYTIDGQVYNIEPNTIFFVSPGQIHELNLSPDLRGHIFLFSSYFYHYNKTNPYQLFELPFFYSLEERTPPLLLTSEPELGYFEGLFLKAIAEAQHNQVEAEEVIRALLDLILIHAKRLYPISTLPASTAKGRVIVKRFKKLIELKSNENLSVKQYAGLLNITANYLSETVKAVTGRTSTDLIQDRMLLNSKQLLQHTRLGISEIAYKLNFADQSYFSKYFKKLSGVGPKEWRRVYGVKDHLEVF